MRSLSLTGCLVGPPLGRRVLAATVVLAGCGGGDSPPAPLAERVQLQITAPADGATIRGGTVDVRGQVSPRASEVTVLGRPALVTDGSFSAVVPLEPGANVIDVAAAAPRRRPAFAAVRVTRDILVSVPDLAGIAEEDLEERLEPFGLRPDVERGGGLFDALRPGERVVCEQRPEAGTRVRRGGVVRVVVARSC